MKKYTNDEFEKIINVIEKNNVKSDDGCIIWTGMRNKSHPFITTMVNGNRISLSVKRFVYQQAHPEARFSIRAKFNAKCNNPDCINPDHLELAKVDSEHSLSREFDIVNVISKWYPLYISLEYDNNQQIAGKIGVSYQKLLKCIKYYRENREYYDGLWSQIANE